jgi:CheY-like chemotaxis protein
MPLHVLLVDDNSTNLAALKDVIGPLAEVDAVSDFQLAREMLRSSRYDRLVANLRLGAYNGLHLVHVAGPDTRSVIYTEQPENWCRHEAQAAGAFYEHFVDLRSSIVGYLDETLPSANRVETDRGDSGAGAARGPAISDDVFARPTVALPVSRSRWIS